MSSIRDHLDTIDALKKALEEASTHRSERPSLVDGPDGHPECEWVAFERSAMRAAVNAYLGAQGRPEATFQAIQEVERQACGHIDYVSKFAIGCAEIVNGRRDFRTGLPERMPA